MSRRKNKNTTLTLDQRIERAVQAEIERKFTPPQGANVTPITQSVIDQMYSSLAPQDKTQGYFSPGAPIRPVPGITPAQGPRQFQYTVGYNIGQLPRSQEMTSFATLRNLAALCDAISICERVWFDLCSKPELEIRPRPEKLVDEHGDPIDPSEVTSKYGARIQKWKDFFAKPDKRRSLKQWMRMALKDVLELDALAIYKHKDRSGGLYALEIIDGATIKPLLDERGMIPYPPYPAYQQFVYGVPGMLILDTDLIYRREVERTDSPYGFSRTEAVIVRVNQILRKENKDLSTFTAGNIPPGFFSPPDDGTTDWTPEQLLMMQEIWDGLLAGNDETRSRGRWVPPGTIYTKTDPDDIMVEFDDFLYTVVFGAFGVPKTEASFTEKSNRSTGETQEAMVYRRTMAPIMDIFGETFTDVMVDEGETDLMAAWKAFEEPEDLKTKAEAWNILVGNGTQSTSQAAHAMGLKPMFETEPFVITKDGPVFIKDVMDLRDATMKAKQAGLQMSIDNPGGMNEQGTQQGAQGTQAGKNGATSNGRGTAKAGGKPAGQPAKNDSGNASGATSRSVDGVVPGQSSDASTERGIDAEDTQVRDATNNSQRAQNTEAGLAYTTRQSDLQGVQGTQASEAGSGLSTGLLQDTRASAERAISDEYRRWRECAIKDIKAERPIRAFVSDIIPKEDHELLSEALKSVGTPEHVRIMFDMFRARPQDAEIIGAQPRLVYNAAMDIWEPADIEDQLQALRAQGNEIVWESHVSESGVCPMCKPNDGVRRVIGEQFPTGHRLPQCHDHCQCAVRVVSSLGAITGGGAK